MNRRATTFIRQLGQNNINYNDWFLPTSLDLYEMYNNLKLYSVGEFKNSIYWSSTEYSTTPTFYARALHFIDGSSLYDYKDNDNEVRPIRSFIISEVSYSLNLRDVGQGGIIFYRTSDGSTSTYYEVAPEDLITTSTWSNITDTPVTGTVTTRGYGLNNTNLIVAQIGHTDSAAKKCLEHVVTI